MDQMIKLLFWVVQLKTLFCSICYPTPADSEVIRYGDTVWINSSVQTGAKTILGQGTPTSYLCCTVLLLAQTKLGVEILTWVTVHLSLGLTFSQNCCRFEMCKFKTCLVPSGDSSSASETVRGGGVCGGRQTRTIRLLR